MINIGSKLPHFGRLFLMLCPLVFLNCEKDPIREEVAITNVVLGQFFTMEPGDTVRFREPFDYRLTLTGFEDFPKQVNTLATATANFEYFIPNGFGGLILYAAQDQDGEGPISFFSSCTPTKISDGGSTLVDVFFIIQEVSFQEDASNFSFNKIRLKMILKESDPNYFCTF